MFVNHLGQQPLGLGLNRGESDFENGAPDSELDGSGAHGLFLTVLLGKVRRNMVTNGDPVTVTGNGATVTEPPLPGRATLSGNRRGSCYRSREQSSVTVPKKQLR